MELVSTVMVAIGGCIALTALLWLCIHCTQQKKTRESEHNEETVIEENKTPEVHPLEEIRNPPSNGEVVEVAPVNTEAQVDLDGRESVSSSGWTPAPPICGGVDFCRQSYGYISPNSRGSQRASFQMADGSLRRDVDVSNGASLSASTAGTIAAWRQEIEEMTGPRAERHGRGLSNTSDGSSDGNFDTASDMSNSSDHGKKEKFSLHMDKQNRRKSDKFKEGHTASDIDRGGKLDLLMTGSKHMGEETGSLQACVDMEPKCSNSEKGKGRVVFFKPQGTHDGVDTSDTDDDEEYSVPPPLNTRNNTTDKSPYQIPKLIMGKN